jgi:hypothetical protein
VQVIKFGDRKPSGVSGPRQFRAPLDEGRPKSAWRNIYLKCGHITTPETQEIYRLWKPARARYYCESCHKWVGKTDWYSFHGIDRPAKSTMPLF